MTAKPTTVLFDLDGTLCTYDRPGAAVLETAFERVGVDPLFEMADFYDRYVDHLRASEDGPDLYERCFTDLARERGADADLGRALARAYLEERGPEDVRPVRGAAETVAHLGTEYRLGLITNGHPAIQRRKLRAIGLEDAFETHVFAGYETAAKPDPEPFERSLEALESSPERAVYVGNSPSIDVAGARAAGLRAALLAGDAGADAEPRPEYVLESLADLRAPPW